MSTFTPILLSLLISLYILLIKIIKHLFSRSSFRLLLELKFKLLLIPIVVLITYILLNTLKLALK
jgi:hypothetical protein